MLLWIRAVRNLLRLCGKINNHREQGTPRARLCYMAELRLQVARLGVGEEEMQS